MSLIQVLPISNLVKHHLHHLPPGVSAFIFHQADGDRLTGQAQRDKDHAPIRQPTQGVAAVGMGLKLNFEDAW